MMQETSLDAYDGIKPELGKRQEKILHAISMLKNPTNLEISNFLGLPINQITPRTNELVKKGYVIEGERKIQYNGRSAISWRLKIEPNKQ